jgi:MarR family transcriptional regulator, organic hydroperoxide resistance regulator
MQDNVKYEARILRCLRRITRAVDIYSRKLNLSYGLTTPQLLCLDVLAKSGTMILKDLAASVNLGESTVNGIIDRLEVKDYVRRKRSQHDRRKVYLEITDAGRTIIGKAPPLLQDRLSASLSALSEGEQRSMTESLERVAELMEAEQWFH